MSPTVIFAAVNTAVIVVATGIAFLIWRRRQVVPTSPSFPPVSAAAASASSAASWDPFDGEWEAHAPYPAHALDAIHSPLSLSRHPSEIDSHYRSSELSTAGAGEAHEPGNPSTPRHRAPVVTESEPDHSSFFPFSPGWTAEALPSRDSPLQCPHCQSARIDTLNVGRKAGSTIGSVAGATSCVAMALSGAETGATVGAIGGPVGSIFGGIAGAVIAGLLGSAAGSAAGSAVGAVIDDNILDNYRCLSCGSSFGAQHI
ncbi:hypothetical protein AB1286_12985 [Trinickia sp. NRRL B-1857]|uniref:hypothetical protein n=1 Tax=Trinickia sp. NRRL B-1857 TaxID=3162879 RepID=UPI003D275FC6